MAVFPENRSLQQCVMCLGLIEPGLPIEGYWDVAMNRWCFRHPGGQCPADVARPQYAPDRRDPSSIGNEE